MAGPLRTAPGRRGLASAEPAGGTADEADDVDEAADDDADIPAAGPARARLKAKGIQWLAGREHSRLELRGKLLRWGLKQRALEIADAPSTGDVVDVSPQAERRALEAEIDAVLDDLQRGRWLDDERFVESRVRERSGKGFGSMRISHELARHGLRMPAESAAALAADDLERARQLLASRYGGEPGDARERARRQRFLAGRGFSAETIARAMRNAED